jgi:uncharacterized protein YqjF (DUF2071 family)
VDLASPVTVIFEELNLRFYVRRKARDGGAEEWCS